jgi:hypothetical protein
VQAVLNLAKADERFTIDAPYYDTVINAGVGGFSLHMIFLDTTTLIRTKKKQNDDQLLWLAQRLKQSNSTMRIVVGFHTPFSDPILGAFLVPILEDIDNNVEAYFSGRERSLQWYKKTRAHYFISGAGAEILKNENPFTKPNYVAPAPGFLACVAGFSEKNAESRLKVAFVSSVGEVTKVVDTNAS